MLAVRTNRAKTFITALEVLRDAANEMLESVKYEELEPYDEAAFEKYRSEHGSLDDVLLVLDDAVDCLAPERNAYVYEAELSSDDLTVAFKERK